MLEVSCTAISRPQREPLLGGVFRGLSNGLAFKDGEGFFAGVSNPMQGPDDADACEQDDEDKSDEYPSEIHALSLSPHQRKRTEED